MASKNIAFDQIPSSIRKPGKYFEFNTKLAVRTLPQNPQQVLIIGQKTSSGTVAAKVPTQVYSDYEAALYFGWGSILHLMCRAAIKANAYLQLSAIALDDASAGAAATGTITITGPSTSNGVLTLYIANQKIQVAIFTTDTATVIAGKVTTQAALQPELPVTIGNVAGVITATAKNKGLCGNSINLAYLITGATGVAAAVVAMANGATNPTIQDALTVVATESYNIYCTPYNNQTDLSTLRDHLDLISGPVEQRPAIAVYATNGGLSASTTLSGQIDHGRINGPYLRYTAATAIQSMPYEIAAAFAAVVAFEEDPARPLNTLELKGIAVADIADRLSRTEQETLLYNGVTPLEIGPGEKVQIVRAITTYVKDAQNIPDIALLDITTIRTLDYVRMACRERISLRFPREKLSSKTPPKVRSELLDVLMKLQDLEIVEQVQENKDGLIVERDEQDPNRLDAKIPCDVVNGLHVFAGRIDLLL